MLVNGDVDDSLDPGYSYYQLDFIYLQPTQRQILSYKPDDLAKASPDLAEEYPTVSKDGKTVTVKLKKGIKFAPPVNREVKAADFKYALERCFLPQVGNGYSNLYFSDIVGSEGLQGRQGQGGHRHHDAGRLHAGHEVLARDRRGRRAGARAAVLGAGAEGSRGQARQGQASRPTASTWPRPAPT